MNWREDEDIIAAEQERSAHMRIVRSAIIWTPLFLICGGAWVFFTFDRIFLQDYGSTWFLVVVLTVLTALFAFPAVQSWLDLRGGPREHDVMVIRTWSRRDAFVVKNHFLKLESGQILEGNALSVEGVKEGGEARVRYYPHSAVLIWAHPVKQQQGESETASA